jgi:hypothetical protein
VCPLGWASRVSSLQTIHIHGPTVHRCLGPRSSHYLYILGPVPVESRPGPGGCALEGCGKESIRSGPPNRGPWKLGGRPLAAICGGILAVRPKEVLPLRRSLCFLTYGSTSFYVVGVCDPWGGEDTRRSAGSIASRREHGHGDMGFTRAWPCKMYRGGWCASIRIPLRSGLTLLLHLSLSVCLCIFF